MSEQTITERALFFAGQLLKHALYDPALVASIQKDLEAIPESDRSAIKLAIEEIGQDLTRLAWLQHEFPPSKKLTPEQIESAAYEYVYDAVDEFAILLGTERVYGLGIELMQACHDWRNRPWANPSP